MTPFDTLYSDYRSRTKNEWWRTSGPIDGRVTGTGLSTVPRGMVEVGRDLARPLRFQLACDHSGQILPYPKMLGRLQDAGNTTTLAHYPELLRNAGMVAGLPKFSESEARSRGSTPKLLVLNTGIMSAASGRDLEGAPRDHEFWGHLTESAVGAHMVNTSSGSAREVSYGRERNHEVDFVLREGRRQLGIEVKTGRRRAGLPGLERFQETYPGSRLLLVGSHGQSLERFLSTSPGLPDPGPIPADGPTPRSRLGHG
jgi:hypothetical protein